MNKYIAFLVCLCIVSSACVSTKKFSDLEVLKEYYKLKNDTLLMMKTQNFNINRNLSSTSANLNKTTAELNNTKVSLEQLQTRYDELNADYVQLEENIEKLSTSSQNETQSLRAQLSQANSENTQMKALLINLDKAYQVSQNGGVMANDSWTNQLRRMQEVSQTLDSEKSQIGTLYSLFMDSALPQESSIETIYYGNKLKLRISADAIFRTGTNQINTKGRNLIKEITGIILRNSNLNVEIEGHTDSKGSDANNWVTSSRRATAIANTMISNEFMPGRILAIGRSSHHPIDPTDSSAARKLNRRIELIIKPRTSLN